MKLLACATERVGSLSDSRMPVFIALITVCLFGASSPAEYDLSWRPAIGSKVEKTLSFKTVWRAPSVKRLIEGNELPYWNHPLGLDLEEQYIMVDELYERVANQPRKFARSYNKIEARQVNSYQGVGVLDPEVIEYVSPLRERTVLFGWNEEDQAWIRSLADANGADKGIVDGLEEDIDFRAFIPQKSVEAGAEWSIEPRAFRLCFAPGGDLAFSAPQGSGATKISGLRIQRFISQHLEGAGKGILRREVMEDGVSCAEIEIEALLNAKGEDKAEHGTTVKAECGIVMKGEILWDLRAHRVRRLEMQSDLTAHVLLKWREGGDAGGWTADVVEELDLAGTTNAVVRFVEK